MTRPYRNALISPRPADPGPVGELEADLGDIDNHAVGIGQRKGAERDLPIEVEDESGLLGVTRQPGV